MISRAPVVSIVLPVRNGAATLDRAIRSVVDQTFGDWELIIVDDGSTDGIADLLRHWSRVDDRIRIISESARGIVAALSRDVSEAKAGLVARMDADDEMKPERLTKQVQLLKAKDHVGLVSCLVEFGGGILNLCQPRGLAQRAD